MTLIDYDLIKDVTGIKYETFPQGISNGLFLELEYTTPNGTQLFVGKRNSKDIHDILNELLNRGKINSERHQKLLSDLGDLKR